MRLEMKRPAIGILVLSAGLFPAPSVAWAGRWDVRREMAEGNREIRRERREAMREISRADSPWEARREIREAHREINRERRERRREVRREILENQWQW
jgi:hypothetical protein